MYRVRLGQVLANVCVAGIRRAGCGAGELADQATQKPVEQRTVSAPATPTTLN